MTTIDSKVEILKAAIRDIPDFPKPGIVFKDITTLTSNPEAFKLATDMIIEKYKNAQIDYVACLESRGFIFGGPIAQALNAGMTLVRKPGKLPGKTTNQSYELEYGTDTIEIHEDAFAKPNARVLIVDDLLATGGTAGASIDLIRKLGADIIGAAFLIELDFLNGKKILDDKNVDVYSLVHY